jgi:hypothetical protein
MRELAAVVAKGAKTLKFGVIGLNSQHPACCRNLASQDPATVNPRV